MNSPVPPLAESSRPAPWSMELLANGTPAPPTPTITAGAPLGASIAACPPCTSQGAMEPGGLCGFPLSTMDTSFRRRWAVVYVPKQIRKEAKGWRGGGHISVQDCKYVYVGDSHIHSCRVRTRRSLCLVFFSENYHCCSIRNMPVETKPGDNC